MRFLTIALSFFFAALVPDGQGVAEAQPLSKWEDERSSLSLQGSYGITGSGLFASSWGVRIQTREPEWPAALRIDVNVRPNSNVEQLGFGISAINGFEWKRNLVPYIGGDLLFLLAICAPTRSAMPEHGMWVQTSLAASKPIWER